MAQGDGQLHAHRDLVVAVDARIAHLPAVGLEAESGADVAASHDVVPAEDAVETDRAREHGLAAQPFQVNGNLTCFQNPSGM